MMSNQERKNLYTLLSSLVDESITQDGINELESILDGNPEAQKIYLHFIGLHQDLQNNNKTASLKSNKTYSNSRWIIGVAALFVVFFTGLFFVLTNNGLKENNYAFAEVIAFDGLVEWRDSVSGKEQKFDVGKKLGSGTIECLSANSWAEIKYFDGTSLIVSGFSELALSDNNGAKLIDLLRGDLSVDAKPQPKGKPMKVISPGARAEVLGTQFNVVAGADSTRYIVNEGLVKVRRTYDGSVQEVPANHFVVARQGQTEEFKSLPRINHEQEWKSELPRDMRWGELIKSTNITSINPAIKALSEYSSTAQRILAPYNLRTKPCILREKGKSPELLFCAALGVSSSGDRPIVVDEDAKFLVKGLIDRSMFGVDDANSFFMGLTTHHPTGGFAGKFVTKRNISFNPEGRNNKFEIEIPVKDFWKIKKGYRTDKLIPKLSIGLELSDVWFVAYQNIGLEINSVEIIVNK
ncbi:MAG: FecR family protein [Verrucomicrobiales bacterium]